LIIAGFLVRLAPLGRYVTPDEPAWVYRSIRFADALAAHTWAAVPSTGHPGVTTMWLGALGVAMQRVLDPTGSAVHLDWIRRMAWLAPENDAAFRRLVFFLSSGRIAVALTTILGLIALYVLLVHLFDRRVALLTAGLLAFDPFMVGHSGLLHTDALLATFSGLSVLCLLGIVRGSSRPWAWSLASGVLAGLSLLTKSLAVFLFPFAALFLGAAWLLRKIQLPKAVALFFLWALAGAAIYWALYPTMWVAPVQTLNDLFGAPGYQSTTGLMPTFFAGRTALRHGPEYYAVALPFRLSPIVVVGLALSFYTIAREKSARPTLAWLWLFAVGYTLFLTLSDKKYDRYLLPVVPLLTLVAALGWEYTGRQVASRQERPHSSSAHLLLPIVQLALLLPFAAYPLTGFNLLTGGPWGAARVLPVDWGEGLGAAARWLNRLPNADQLAVAAPSIPCFAALFDGRTVPPDQASLADYVVLGSTYLSAQPTDSLTNRPTSQPIHTAYIGFLAHAAIYTNTAPLEQAAYLAAHAGADDLILLDADTPLLRRYTGPGALVSVAGLPDQAAIAARLAELSAGRATLWLVADPAAAPISTAHLHQVLEAVATPVHTVTIASTHITQFANPQSTFSILHSPLATFGDHLTLVDALLPAAPTHTSFPIYLRWQVSAPTPTNVHTSLYLQDAARHLWADVGQPMLNSVYFPTSAWASGEWADNVMTLKLPEYIPPGTYAVQLTVTDDTGAQVGAWNAGGQFLGVRVGLGNVEIAPPDRPAGPAPCAGQVFAASPFTLCIPDLSPLAIPSGDTLALPLTWSAAVPPQADYRVRWRLVDVAGNVALEQIAALSPYSTSHWRAGDSFDALYDLALDPAVPAAVYDLALNVLASEGSPLWASDERLATVQVLPRDRLFEVPTDIAYPLDLTLGNVVHLRGFDFSPPPQEEGAGERIFRPGDTLPLTLYWQAGGPTDLGYTIFVHLIGPDGRPHGQVDQFPGGGGAPTTSWAPGQVIIDAIKLPVAADAPAGTYQIAVGMYDAASGGRLAVADSSGHLLAGDQVILPVEVTIAGGLQ